MEPQSFTTAVFIFIQFSSAEQHLIHPTLKYGLLRFKVTVREGVTGDDRTVSAKLCHLIEAFSELAVRTVTERDKSLVHHIVIL